MGGQTIRVERRFCGPPQSGNGGYVAGRLAAFVDAPAVGVRLRLPPALDTALAVRQTEDAVMLFDGEAAVAEARAVEFELAAPPAPTFEEAEEASRGFRGFKEHVFPGCFVCGPERNAGDGLRIFPGPAARNSHDTRGDDQGNRLFAAPWIPSGTLISDGSVRAAGEPISDEFVWAALDCPGAFAFPQPKGKVILLGEMKVSLSGKVSVDERCVLTSWRIESQGRKHFTGSALYGAAGDCRGVALGLWFEVDPATVPGR